MSRTLCFSLKTISLHEKLQGNDNLVSVNIVVYYGNFFTARQWTSIQREVRKTIYEKMESRFL